MTESQWDVLLPPEEISIGRFRIRTQRVNATHAPEYPVFALRSAAQSQRIFVMTMFRGFHVDVQWAPRGKTTRRKVTYSVANWENQWYVSTSRRCDSLEEAFDQVPDVVMEIAL